MIRFALNCTNDHAFEGWFRDGAAFDRQAGEGAIVCPTCGDNSVRKAMMAPAVVRSSSRAVAAPAAVAAAPPAPAPPVGLTDHAKAAAVVAMLRTMRAHVEKNFDNVGERFPEEARRIHYGEAEERQIYGQATIAEARDLVDEGIQVRPLPDVPELDG
jgi:hypothetical protein